MKRIFAIVLLMAVRLAAQTPITSAGSLTAGSLTINASPGGVTCNTNGWCTGEGTTPSGQLLINNGSWLQSVSGANTWVPPESRKVRLPLTTIAQVRVTARQLSQADLAPAAYLKLARSVGLESPATDEAKMLDVISGLGLKVFDYTKVDEYLYEQALTMKANTRWVWKPMRSFDEKALETAGVSYQLKGDGFFYPRQYAKRIPEQILTLVCDIMEAQPNTVFLVSDFEVVKPDPFLAITTKQLLSEGKVWVIANWSEPGFTDKGTTPSPVVHKQEPQLTAER